MKKKSIVALLVVMFIAAAAQAAAAEEKAASVSEAFEKLSKALAGDPAIAPEVKEALREFGRAVTRMEDKMGAVPEDGEAAAREKVAEWFGNAERCRRMEDFFGTAEKKGFIEKFSMFGDWRFRFETTTNSGGKDADPNNRTRTRYRMRLRLGGEYEVAPNAWIGARLVTGPRTDPLSANQTLDRNFQKWEFSLDNAYLHWAPLNGAPWKLGESMGYTADFWLGKFEHGKTFMHTPMSWDSNVQPEGIAMRNAFKRFGFLDELQLNLAGYVLTEDADQQDASMAVMQAVAKKTFDVGLPAPLEFALASGLYDINDTDTNANGSMIVSRGLSSSSCTPTLVNHGGMVFQSNYELLDNILEMRYKGIEFMGRKMPLTLTGEYIYNTNAAPDEVHGDGKQNKAHSFSAKFGEAKKKGEWAVGAAYFYAERDALYSPVAAMTDFALAGNMKGAWACIDYAIFDNVVLKLWGLWDNPIKADAAGEIDEHFRLRMQIDVKF